FKDMKVLVDPSKGIESETVELESPITIRQLFTHTAGFTHGLSGSAADRAYMQKIYFKQHENIAESVDVMAQLPLFYQPGTKWVYSNSPDILSALIEHFSGMTTAKFLEERLFKPLGMKDSGYNLSPEQQERMVKLHTYNSDRKIILSPRQTPTTGNKVFRGANALFSSAPDYMQFCKMILNNGSLNGTQFLSKKTIEILSMDHANGLCPYDGLGFGLGFAVMTNVAESGQLGSLGQLSWGGAYSTYFFIDPKEELATMLFTQVSPYQLYYTNMMRQFVYQAIID
ncbi:MAG: serine hydrolase domain-containing protein, partial [Bacteroidota bacterium]